MNSVEYIAALFRGEAARLRDEAFGDEDTRVAHALSGTTPPLAHLAASLDRMADKAAQTAASGQVEEV